MADPVPVRRGRYPADAGGSAPADRFGRPLCERSLAWDGEGPSCLAPAAVLTRAMCVHEHLGQGYCCWGCLSDMRKFCDDSEWLCEECGTGPESHDCPMPVQVTPLEAS